MEKIRVLVGKRVIPIHTFHPERFASIGEEIKSLGDGETLML